jgi:hypothetical protein
MRPVTMRNITVPRCLALVLCMCVTSFIQMKESSYTHMYVFVISLYTLSLYTFIAIARFRPIDGCRDAFNRRCSP